MNKGGTQASVHSLNYWLEAKSCFPFKVYQGWVLQLTFFFKRKGSIFQGFVCILGLLV